MRLHHCQNFHDFRELARRRLPGPIFNYIDGGADDETTLRRNTRAFEECDLVPSVLTGLGVPMLLCCPLESGIDPTCDMGW